MKARYFPLVLFLAFVDLWVSAAVATELTTRPLDWAQPVLGFDLGNFYKVSDEVYRSRQPDKKALHKLESAGFRAILNLRGYHSDESEVKGLKLYRVPMNAGEINDETMEQALEIVANAPKPMLVHCWHGSDRTGAVIAMYRMVFEEWPREKAIDEFKQGGYGYHQGFYPNIERYLEAVDVQRFQRRLNIALKKESAGSEVTRE